MHNESLTSIIPQNSTLIVGFSGGPDSVFLLTKLYEIQESLNLKIIAAHLDHQWRKESAKDAIWCKNFCSTYPNITFISSTPKELNFDIKHNGSQEEVGRKIRRAFFKQLANQHNADHILLAHHQNDQIENFFIRLIRSSSTTGLSSMRQHDGLYLRPLLNMPKQKILDWLHSNNMQYLTDSSNLDTKFLRNNIRHNLIPQLNQIDPRFEKNIIKTIENLQNTEDFLHQQTMQTLQKICDPQNNHKIDVTEFLTLHPVLQHRLLLQLLIDQKIIFTPSKSFFAEIKRFLENKKSISHQISNSGLIIKEKNYFFFKSL